MRIEQQEYNIYTKHPDRIDAYLIRIINRFFNSHIQDIENTREGIINEAINRMKLEILGLSANGLAIPVTSVNGKTGTVVINADDIGAEPKFAKRTAFNKDFGTTAGTVCEGNDPRLSDQRIPLAHRHDVTEINNINNAIDTNANLQQCLSKAHTHSNISTLNKVTYSGAKTSIDLIEIENLKNEIDTLSLNSGTSSINDHITNTDIHVTAQNKYEWNAKETTIGAQQKADLAEQNSKLYTDTKINEIKGTPPTSLNNIQKLAAAINNDPNFSTNVTNALNNKLDQTYFNAHINDNNVHVTQSDKNNWNNKADANHNHDDIYYTKEEIDIKINTFSGVSNLENLNLSIYAKVIDKGNSKFNGTTGTIITMPNTYGIDNTTIIITPIITENPTTLPNIGQWFVCKKEDSFIVYNTGDIDIDFEYTILLNDSTINSTIAPIDDTQTDEGGVI